MHARDSSRVILLPAFQTLRFKLKAHVFFLHIHSLEFSVKLNHIYSFVRDSGAITRLFTNVLFPLRLNKYSELWPCHTHTKEGRRKKHIFRVFVQAPARYCPIQIWNSSLFNLKNDPAFFSDENYRYGLFVVVVAILFNQMCNANK